MAEGIRNKCDFCKEDATVDGKTQMGPWAFMCEAHFNRYGIKQNGLFKRLEVAVVAKKICTCCGQEKPVTEFYMYTDHNQVVRYRNECKSCNLSKRSVIRKNKKEG